MTRINIEALDEEELLDLHVRRCNASGRRRLAAGQQTHHLSFGDLDTDIVQQRRQALGCYLTLSVQHQAEPAQAGP